MDVNYIIFAAYVENYGQNLVLKYGSVAYKEKSFVEQALGRESRHEKCWFGQTILDSAHFSSCQIRIGVER